MKFKYTEAELRAHLDDVEDALATERDPDQKRRLREELAATERELQNIRDRKSQLLALADDPHSCLSGDGAGGGEPLAIRGDRDRALRVIERNADVLGAKAGDRLDALVRVDPSGVEARYLVAVADADYRSAFGKMLAHPLDAHFRMTPKEVAAVQKVTQVMAERAMSIGGSGGADGGYGVPFALDPTILMSASGALNPVRQVARSITIATDVWKGVSSDGVTAHWYAEAAEASDDSPTLAQPSVTVRRASAFVPFSIEVGQDYAGLEAELGRLLADAKDVLEAQAFLDGVTASNQPIGILAATGGLGASQKVETAGSGAFAIGDCYSLKEAIPARFQPGAVVLGNPSTFDVVYRFVGGGSTEPPVLPTREGSFLGLAKHEWSNMATGAVAGTKLLIAGNVREAFAIVDRIGMSVELIPHLLGSNHRPTGQRGLYAWWRVGSAPINSNAARFLQVKA